MNRKGLKLQASRKMIALIMVSVVFIAAGMTAFASTYEDHNGIKYATASGQTPDGLSNIIIRKWEWSKDRTTVTFYLNTDLNAGGVQIASSATPIVSLVLPDSNYREQDNSKTTIYYSNGYISSIEFKNLKNDDKGNILAFRIYYNDPVLGRAFYPIELDVYESSGWVVDPDPDPDPAPSEDPVILAALTPHLIVSSYSYPGSKVTAGTDFTLTYTLKNTSSDKAIRNVILVVTPSADLRIKSNANTFHIDRIPAGGTVERSIVLNLPVAAEKEIQNVDIAVTFQYYDKPEEDPVSGGDEIIITIPSGRITRAKITEVKIPKNFSIGKEGNIEFSVINNGFSQIYNVEAFVYDGEDNELGWLYLGHMEGGAQPIKQQLPLTFQEGGYYDLRLVVQYEDENLQMTTLEKDFVIDIEIPQEPDIWYPEPEPDPNEGLEPEPEEKSKINPILIAAIIVVVLAAGVVIFVKIKRKREDSFDDYFDSFEAGTPEKKAMDTETPKKDEILEDAKKKDKRGKKADKQ